MAKYPDEKECYRLLKEYHIPLILLRHSEQVAYVAKTIAQKFKDSGIDIDVSLVQRSALLHDIARASHFSSYESPEEEKFWKGVKEKYKGRRHGEMAYDIFKQDYPELANIILKHAYGDIVMNPPKTWEEKIVNYADKRVSHDQIVSLKERLREAHERWSKNHEGTRKVRGLDIKEVDKLLFDLEAEIFDKIGMKPEELEF